MAKTLKVYTLSDGYETTAYEVADRANVTIRVARTRLSVSNDPAKVFMPKQEREKKDLESYKIRTILAREASMYNEMFRLAFKKI